MQAVERAAGDDAGVGDGVVAAVVGKAVSSNRLRSTGPVDRKSPFHAFVRPLCVGQVSEAQVGGLAGFALDAVDVRPSLPRVGEQAEVEDAGDGAAGRLGVVE